MGSSGAPNLPPAGQPSDTEQPKYQPGSVPNVTTFGFTDVEPPSPIYVQRDDILVLQAGTTIPTGDTVVVNARLLQAPFAQGGQPSDYDPAKATGRVITHGVIEPIQRALVLPNSLTFRQLQIPLTEGYLLSLAINSMNANARGQTFVRAYLIRGISSVNAPQPYEVLVADYATILGAVGWPNGRQLYPTEPPGNLISFVGASGGAGLDWAVTVPGISRWRVQSVVGLFTTSVAVAARTVRLQILDNIGVPVYETGNNNVQAAGLVIRYSYGPGTGTFQSGPASFVASLPEAMVLDGGWKIQTVTDNIDVADQWTFIRVVAEELVNFI